MIDPEEQLRRLAEGRAESVDPFRAEEVSGEIAAVVELAIRRWPAAVAAGVLAIGAVGAMVFAVLVGPDGRGAEFADDAVAIAVTSSAASSGDSTESGPGVHTASTSTTVVPPDVSIPDVVGDDADAALAALDEAGLEALLRSVFVDGADERLGEVIEVTAEGEVVEVVVARLAPSSRSTDPCLRPAHLLGMFDDDALVDRVHPRFVDGRITEIEICTGAGERVIGVGLDLHRIELVTDIDGDGLDDLVASTEADGLADRAWSLVDGALVENPALGDTGIQVAPIDPAPECLINELDVAMAGDVDGDGDDDFVSVRDGVVCLVPAGPVVSLGAAGDDAGIWFLDDIDGDGAVEVFIGATTVDDIRVRPYSISADGRVEPAAVEDCCVQTTLDAAVRYAAAAASTDQPTTARWFSCVAGEADGSVELVSGRFWVDLEDGRVDWTVDVGTEASIDVTYSMTFDDPLSTDAWIPGNGCRNNAARWIAPATIEFDDDGTATAASIEAFNTSITGDDPGRRVIRLREALGVADRLSAASGTGHYRESIDDGRFELVGLDDESIAGVRWRYRFSDDGTMLESVVREWSCQPEGGAPEFSTEACP